MAQLYTTQKNPAKIFRQDKFFAAQRIIGGGACKIANVGVRRDRADFGRRIFVAFRLTVDQFALINLVELGNKNFQPQLLTVKQIQLHAAKVDAQLDGYLSADNKKIVVPEKLSVEFTEHGDKVKVQPVLLENRDGILKPIDSADFQGAFDNRKKILDVYNLECTM